MHSIILIGEEDSPLKLLLEESIEVQGRVMVHPSIGALFPRMLSEEPLLAFIDGKLFSINELGSIKILKNTFPSMKILFSFPTEMRSVAAQALTYGADAYILEPYYMDEMIHFIRHAYTNALHDLEQSVELRMNALALFIQGLAPEINNRLTPILGTLQLLMGKDSDQMDEEEKRENYQCMYRESLRISKTIDELENFARPRKPKKNSISARSTIDMAIAEARKGSTSEVPIEDDFNATVDTVLIDQGKIVTALGAVIRFLRAASHEDKGRIVVATYTPDPKTLYVTVEGFETLSLGEDVDHAFIPLYMKRIVRFGHELGLASAYGLVRAHGGAIRIETTPRGSKFHITIPAG